MSLVDAVEKLKAIRNEVRWERSDDPLKIVEEEQAKPYLTLVQRQEVLGQMLIKGIDAGKIKLSGLSPRLRMLAIKAQNDFFCKRHNIEPMKLIDVDIVD